MIIWPPKGLAGLIPFQAFLTDFLNRNPQLANLPIDLNVRGHPTAVGYHIILGPTIPNGYGSGNIGAFIMHASRLGVAIGPIRGIDGDGLQNWISFSRDLRTGDPRTVTKICLLCLLQLNNLLVWP